MSGSRITNYDAVVVGAGPAGAHLSYLLARAGQRVALLDKQRFPRDKVCGGGLSRKSVSLLDTALSAIVHTRIVGAYLTFRNRSAVVKDVHPDGGCTVLRDEFDHALVMRACDAGAEFFAQTTFRTLDDHGDRVTATTDAGVFTARKLFAADGVTSAVRAHVFGKKIVSYVAALEAIVQVPDASLRSFAERAVFDFGGMPRGYGWIFPKRDHLNVGIYSPFGGNALRSHLDAFIDRYPALRTHCAIDYRGFAIPIRNDAGVFERGRVALIGDAAGVAEPLFGEGIYFALKSAALAAQAELVHEREPHAMRYTQLLERELLPELRAARRLACALYAFPEFSFRRLVCNERVNPLFTGLITGETGYRECLRDTLLAAPSWLLPSKPLSDARVA